MTSHHTHKFSVLTVGRTVKDSSAFHLRSSQDMYSLVYCRHDIGFMSKKVEQVSFAIMIVDTTTEDRIQCMTSLIGCSREGHVTILSGLE